MGTWIARHFTNVPYIVMGTWIAWIAESASQQLMPKLYVYWCVLMKRNTFLYDFWVSQLMADTACMSHYYVKFNVLLFNYIDLLYTT